MSNNSTIYAEPRGGFGNILFIYLIGKSLSKKYNMTFKFTKSYVGNRLSVDKYTLFSHCSNEDPPNNCIQIKESKFKYYSINLPTNNYNFLLYGYFQSYKHSADYFDEIKQELLDNIKPQYNRIQELYTSLTNENEKTIMLHVRRGDYLKLAHFHTNQPDEYYEKALDILLNDKLAALTNIKILLFSDDIEFLKTWKVLDTLKQYPNVSYTIINITDTVDSFLLMSLCDNFIIANSSFSLLSYYFRNNKDAKLCAPSRWFEPKGPDYSMDDFIDINDNVFII